MQIAGLQKLTLLDYPKKISCIIFTAGCNLRCPFCHNAEVVNKTLPLIPLPEIFNFLEKRKNVLEGVCVTGGEPLLQDGLEEFLKRIKDMGFLVKLDTNGTFPDRLASLIEKKLVDYIAMDVKNSPEKYSVTVGCNIPYSDIKKSAEIIIASGLDYEFRTTLVKEFHTLTDLEEIAKAFKCAKRFYLQSFVPSDNLLGSLALTPLSEQETNAALAIFKKYIPDAEVR